MIGKLKYGPNFMNIQGDRTQEHSVGLCAWDDEGVPAVVLMFMGVALFGAIAATLATVFLRSDSRQNDALLVHIARLEAKIDQLVEGRTAQG